MIKTDVECCGLIPLGRTPLGRYIQPLGHRLWRIPALFPHPGEHIWIDECFHKESQKIGLFVPPTTFCINMVSEVDDYQLKKCITSQIIGV
jgi:hypothetical protein